MFSGCSVFCKTPPYIYYVYMFWLCSYLLFVWNGMKLLLCIINEWVCTEILPLNPVGMAHAYTDIHKQNHTRKKTTTSSILHLSNEKGLSSTRHPKYLIKVLKVCWLRQEYAISSYITLYIYRDNKKTWFIPESMTLKSLIAFIHWLSPYRIFKLTSHFLAWFQRFFLKSFLFPDEKFQEKPLVPGYTFPLSKGAQIQK